MVTSDFILVSLNLSAAWILPTLPPLLSTGFIKRSSSLCSLTWTLTPWITVPTLRASDGTCEMLINMDFPEQDSMKYGQDSNDKFVWTEPATEIQASCSLSRVITHIYDMGQLCTTAEAEIGIERFTSCFAGHEDLKQFVLKIATQVIGFFWTSNAMQPMIWSSASPFWASLTVGYWFHSCWVISWHYLTEPLSKTIVLKSILHARVMPKI